MLNLGQFARALGLGSTLRELLCTKSNGPWYLVPYSLDGCARERLVVRPVLAPFLTNRRSRLGCIIVTWACLASSHAFAHARVLPFSYAFETLHEEQVVIEQALDARSAIVIDNDGRRAWDPQFRMQFEWGYGVSDSISLGVGLVLSSAPGASVFLEGTKQRLHSRLIDQSISPIEVGVSFEVVEFRTVLAFEQRLVLQRRWGSFRIIGNTGVAEELPEYHPVVTFIVEQTIGPALQISKHMHVAAEYWLRLGIGARESGQTTLSNADTALMHSDPDIGIEVGS